MKDTGETIFASANDAAQAVLIDHHSAERPRVCGKFLYVGNRKFYARGVTYGPFASDGTEEYHDPETVERDFAAIAATGANCLRTYTIPPRWLLDIAHRHRLYVMIGLPWEQHVAFLDERRRARGIVRRVRDGVRKCAGHPAVLCYAVGNEVPAHIVRWYGHRRVERYLERLYWAAKKADPGCLVTYVNYPSTEYLDLPFLDLVCFNVYLESQDKLAAYLARLQNIAGDRPLLMAEIGLDSLRNGEAKQAETLTWQLTTIFGSGCCGAFVFSWTDEWSRGGEEIKDWDFGLTRRDRSPKPALHAVATGFANVPFARDLNWPRISVVVCTYNGVRWLRETLDGLHRLEYPDYEVILVDDGSTKDVASIAADFDVRYIRTENRGLSAARNTGMQEAIGEIVAYIDDDAYPDPHWLHYLAATFMNTSHVGVGGPNVAPASDGPIARCVAHAPGGPIHVLLTDHEAEHLPGCNMAFRRDALMQIGGFDPIFRIAGDDVDVCWRLQEQGWTLGFHAAALVWHHRRNSVRTFWKQQLNYGKAEADLERKWPQKYNAVGHATWAGRLYSKSMIRRLGFWSTPRIYHGTWGSALFQSVAPEAPSFWRSLPAMPEWWMLVISLFVGSLIGVLWRPMQLLIPLLLLAIMVPAVLALFAGMNIRREYGQPRRSWIKYWAVTSILHFIQPIARLMGRFGRGLTPWRRRGVDGFSIPWKRTFTIWSETWQAGDARLRALEAHFRGRGAAVRRGGDFDRWDLELRAGMLGAVRIDLVVEEHGQGKQLVRFRAWPRTTSMGLSLISALAFVSLIDAGVASLRGAAICGIPALVLALRSLQECAAGMAAVKAALRSQERGSEKAQALMKRVVKQELGVTHATHLPHSRPRPIGRDERPDESPLPADARLASEG